MCRRFLSWFVPAMVSCVAFGLEMLPNEKAAAEEPRPISQSLSTLQPGLNLLAVDAKNEWITNRASTAGWTIKDGKLSGNEKSTPLVSDCKLGDFELHVCWKVTDGGAIRLLFPNDANGKPTGQGVEISLAEQPGISIRLPQGAKILKVDPQLKGKLHRTVIKRVGDQLVLDCDGTKSREMPCPADIKLGLTLAVKSEMGNAIGTIESLRLVEQVGNNASLSK